MKETVNQPGRCDACAAGAHCFGGRCPCCCREPEGGRLAAIRAVLDEADRGDEDLSLVLARIDQLANSSRTDSGIEPGGGAYLTAAGLKAVLSALDVAADYRRDLVDVCGDCPHTEGGLCGACDYRMTMIDEYDAIAAKLGGAQ